MHITKYNRNNSSLDFAVFYFDYPMSSFSQKKLFIAYEDSLMRIAPTILQGKNDANANLQMRNF